MVDHGLATSSRWILDHLKHLYIVDEYVHFGLPSPWPRVSSMGWDVPEMALRMAFGCTHGSQVGGWELRQWRLKSRKACLITGEWGCWLVVTCSNPVLSPGNNSEVKKQGVIMYISARNSSRSTIHHLPWHEMLLRSAYQIPILRNPRCQKSSTFESIYIIYLSIHQNKDDKI